MVVRRRDCSVRLSCGVLDESQMSLPDSGSRSFRSIETEAMADSAHGLSDLGTLFWG